MNDKVIKVYKKCGETPLECINNLKKEDEKLRLLPMTYAGRLDPLAEGLLLILVGDECLKKDEYLNLSKEYEVDVLFGFSTDTYDVMGKIINNKAKPELLFKRSSDLKDTTPISYQFSGPRTRDDEVPDHENLYESSAFKIQEIIPNFIGKIKQSYPPYSSRPVNGKPLFEWARTGKLNEIEIPIHDVNVSNIEIIGENKISGENLLKKIKEDISKVGGDFRQKEILSLWVNELKDKYEKEYSIVRLKISCGSGAYMRVIAHEIGEKLDIPALALKIVRTKIGEYTI